jgi:hypothetical protein
LGNNPKNQPKAILNAKMGMSAVGHLADFAVFVIVRFAPQAAIQAIKLATHRPTMVA